MKNKCDCKHCEQHKINYDETDWNCISFGFVVRIIKNILECDDSLTSEQRDSMRITYEIIEKLDKDLVTKE